MGRPALLAMVAAMLLSGGAGAQVPYGMTRPSNEMQNIGRMDGLSARRFEDGVASLQSKNYLAADGVFREILRQNPNNVQANFLMGVTQMGLGKWSDARDFLEIAVRKDPKNADPKSRLAVAYVKLGDRDAALKQRADLQKMSDACKNKCRNAQWIAAGLAMVDDALANAAAAPAAPAS